MVAGGRRISVIKAFSLSFFQCIAFALFALVAWNNTRFMFGVGSSSGGSVKTETALRKRPFLLWEDKSGISLPSLIGFIQERLEAPPRDRWDPWLIYTVDENANLWISHRILDQYQDEKMDKERMQNRLNPADELFFQALELLKRDETTSKEGTQTKDEWPFLRRAIRQGGFPFVVFVGDACVEQQRNNRILPIFNLCIPVHSKNSFAFATYQTWYASKSDTSRWNETFEEQRTLNPWATKIPRAVWRGTPTGYLDEKNENQRWRLCRLGRSHSDIMDVGFHVNPPLEQAALNMTEVGLVPGMPERNFMKYRAIFDLDGNFWSQRFGSLLCSSSVVLKVEPQWVDYFHFTLEAWKHYIPVKGDLSDVVERVKFAVADDKDQTVQSIISNANIWCANHMVKSHLARDFLDSLDWYAQQLYVGDSSWPTTWNRERRLVFAEKNKLKMRTTTPLY